MPPPNQSVATLRLTVTLIVALTQKLLLLRFVTIYNFFFSFSLLAELPNFNLTCSILLNLAPVKVIGSCNTPTSIPTFGYSSLEMKGSM